MNYTFLFSNAPYVKECIGEIEKAKKMGFSSCYCETGKSEMMRKFAKMLITTGYTVETCSIKGVVVWDIDSYPNRETLKDVEKKESLYIDWSGEYQTSYFQSMLNQIVCRETVRSRLDWNKDKFDLFKEVNANSHR